MDIQRTGREIATLVMGTWRYIIPNAITLTGLFAGLTAVPLAIAGNFGLAIAFILAAAVLDALDGAAARLLEAHSEFGKELDSLADFVSFGAAPAVILYLWGLQTMPILGWAAVLIFAGASALRLARFNVNAGNAEPAWKRRFFTGVPAPAGAILLLLPLYIEGLGVKHSLMPAFIVAVYCVVVAGLMVSRYPTFSPKSGDPAEGRLVIPALIFAGTLVLAALAYYPYLTLFLGTLLYAASIPLAVRVYRKNLEREMPMPLIEATEAPPERRGDAV
jgi:CDP-diacylglycerol---serine O-phosphatidyltransferase